MEKEEEVVESFIIPIYDRPIKICDGVLTYKKGEERKKEEQRRLELSNKSILICG